MEGLYGSHAPTGAAAKTVSKAWEKFLSGEELPSGAVRRLIEDSWRRSSDSGANPAHRAAPLAVKGDGLYSLQSRYAEVIAAARPVLEQAREFLMETGTAMVLTDPAGIVLAIEGDASIKDYGQGIHLSPGGKWDETFLGTNAVGTALATGGPVQIRAHEHFCEEIQRWTCSANVIRDPIDGSILGVLDVSGLNGGHHTHCLALAVSGTDRIESRLVVMEMEKRARLLDFAGSNSNRWANNGIVVFDRRGRLVRANDDAGRYLSGLGMDLKACQTMDMGAANDGTPGTFAQLPKWVEKDWIEPVVERNERLGTLLVIPMPTVKSKKTSHFSGGGEGAELNKGPMSAIIGTSDVLMKVKKRALQLAKLSVPVLLLGPTGAGKEVFARSLHEAGANASGAFVPLNCGGMTRDLLASELFGYVEGAFTGARRGGQIGKFEAADGGTLFLDEIGEMPMELQPHFLRVLEEGVVYRLGENKPRPVNVRLIAATNRDLRAEVAEGNFRMDLFYRLAVTVLHLPGLAERQEDIAALAAHFAEATAKRYGVSVKYPPRDVLDALQAYPWPGNVRELRNVIESMVLLAEGDVLTLADLPAEVAARRGEILPMPIKSGEGAVGGGSGGGRGKLADCERNAIVEAIRAEAGNLTKAADRLDIAKSTLYEKMKRHGLDRDSVIG